MTPKLPSIKLISNLHHAKLLFIKRASIKLTSFGLTSIKLTPIGLWINYDSETFPGSATPRIQELLLVPIQKLLVAPIQKLQCVPIQTLHCVPIQKLPCITIQKLCCVPIQKLPNHNFLFHRVLVTMASQFFVSPAPKPYMQWYYPIYNLLFHRVLVTIARHVFSFPPEALLQLRIEEYHCT